MAENPWLAPRRLAIAEQMDAPDIPVADLAAALKFIRKINHWLGYTRNTVRHLAKLARDLPADQPLRVLDVATGSADVPVAVLKWAKRAGRKVEVVGLDLHASTLAEAAVYAGNAVRLVRGDALALPFVNGAFDFVMTSMFLHHLPDDLAAAVLREMARVASRGIVAADLVRHPRAYKWICLFTAFTRPMIKHDARASVLQAFTLAEANALRQAAGLTRAEVHPHVGHRFVIAGPI